MNGATHTVSPTAPSPPPSRATSILFWTKLILHFKCFRLFFRLYWFVQICIIFDNRSKKIPNYMKHLVYCWNKFSNFTETLKIISHQILSQCPWSWSSSSPWPWLSSSSSWHHHHHHSGLENEWLLLAFGAHSSQWMTVRAAQLFKTKPHNCNHHHHHLYFNHHNKLIKGCWKQQQMKHYHHHC